ncbi:leucine-rich repeat-containing protein 43 isoform X1 [Rhineura floridana]|uniref:leucine-rich repeat-containing protein 43 isoform X1 n=1 Tax=Rhineura floridana TaxID=261503 RepID=UPI002AC88BB6|nr:leucine-rich repeat-containing protein 43 isoform X1 [Rhineura floridana]
MAGLSASAAFWEHLRRLCLDQFPCGTGSWNKSRFPPRKAKVFHRPVLGRTRAVPHNGLRPPDEETAESLTEFLRSLGSPWAFAPDCSPEDQRLRELAVQSPRDIQDSFIFSYFKSLRIVNKNVTEIDADLLKFPNLEELILSANHISKINSINLPPTLKVLELCGNEVDGLKDLCAPPPPELQHLGLGHNCQLGSSEELYLTGTYWPNLVSLDLSYNNFTNLLTLLSKLLTMKQLRILVLQGNPLALLPGYRGFTIDSLPRLCTLDDVIITPDERHNFLDLASNPGNIYSTPRKPWAEVIECEYTKGHITRDLVALKAYLLAGTTVTVVEEKVVSWPVVITPKESPIKKGKEKGKTEKGKADKGKKDKGKEEKGKAKDAGKAGTKKKKKSPSPELRSDIPILKILGSGHVSLESLLAGESHMETVCDFGILITELRVPPPSPKEKDSKKGSKKDKKSKAGTESATTRKATSPAKGKGKKKDSPEGADILQSQPAPLTVEFQMEHIKWKSASQILLNRKASE